MRARFRFSRVLLLWGFFSASAFALEVGDAWEGPPPELGKPLGKLVAGERTLYRWPDLEVTVAGGRIAQIKRLDAASVAAETEERSKASAAEHARLLAERKERARAEAQTKDKAAAEAAREAKLVAERAGRAQAEEAARQKSEAEGSLRKAELAERQAWEKTDRDAKEAARRARAAESSGAGPAPAASSADQMAKLEREILFLELDLKRAEAGSEPADRTRAAGLRAVLKERRAQLEALKKKS